MNILTSIFLLFVSFNISVNAASISGRLFDEQSKGIGNETIDLLDQNGTLLEQHNTKSDGSYSFSVDKGTFLIRPPQNSTYYPSDGTKSERLIEITNASQNASSVDFTTNKNIPSVKLLFPRTGDKLKGDFGFFGTAFKSPNCSDCPDIEHLELRVNGKATFVAKMLSKEDRLTLSQIVWGSLTNDGLILNKKWEELISDVGYFSIQIAAKNTAGQWGLSNIVYISKANTTATANIVYPDGFSPPVLAPKNNITLTGKVEGEDAQSHSWYVFESGAVNDINLQNNEFDTKASNQSTITKNFPIEDVYPVGYTALDSKGNTLVSIKQITTYRPAYKGDLEASRSGSREAGLGVNVVSGNFYYQTAAMSLTGINIPFNFWHRYTSLSHPNDNQEHSMLGNGGWGHSYEYAIFLSPSGRRLYLKLPDGHWERFALIGDKYESLVPGSPFVVGPEFDSKTSKIKHFIARDGSGATYYFDYLSSEKRRTWYLGRIEDTNGNKLSLNYQGDQLVKIVDTRNKEITFSYENGLLTEVKDYKENSIRYKYSNDGFLESYTDREGNTWVYEYELFGQKKLLTHIKDPEGRTVIRNYYSNSPEQNVATFWNEYRVHSQIDGGGYKWIFDYLPTVQKDNYAYSQTKVTNPLNEVITYTINESHLVSQVDFPNGGALKHKYRLDASSINDKSLPTEVSSPEQKNTQVNYGDSKLGNPQQMTDPAQRKTDLEWIEDPNTNVSNLLSIKLPDGRKTTIKYDTHHNPIEVTDPMQRVSKLEYNDKGQIIKRTNPLGQSSSYTYYTDGESKGFLQKITNALGDYEEFFYDDKGRVKTTRSKSGITSAGQQIEGFLTHYTYNNNDQIISVSRSNGTTEFSKTFSYDKSGKTRTITSAPLNIRTIYEYEQGGRGLLISKKTADLNNNAIKSDGVPHITHYEYDELQRLKKVINPRQSEIQTTFTKNGEVETNIAADGHYMAYFYDKDGNVTQTEYRTADKQLIYTVQYQYNELDQLVEKRVLGSTHTEDLITRYGYNASGKLDWVRDSRGKHTYYAYDLLDRVIQVTQENVKGNIIAKMEYDESKTIWQKGLRVVVTPPLPIASALSNEMPVKQPITDLRKIQTFYHYNEIGQLVEKVTPDGNIWAYSYMPSGALESHTNGKGETTRYSYDNLGRLEIVTYPNYERTQYLYNDKENSIAVKKVDPIGNVKKVTQKYDVLNRLSERTDALNKTLSYQYDTSNNLRKLIYPDGKPVEYQYDISDRMSTVTDWLGNVTAYNYDKIGRLEKINHSNQTQVTMGYDKQGRLKQYANRRQSGETIADYLFELDENGNRTKATVNQPLLPDITNIQDYYFYNEGNQLISSLLGSTSQNLSYDQEGRVQKWGDTILGYDYQHHLTSVQQKADKYEYQYSPTNERIASIKNGSATRFVVNTNSGLPNVLMRLDDNDKPLDYFVYGASGLVSQITADNQVLTYHFDPSGNTVAQTDTTQMPINAYAYLPYGQANRQEKINNPFEFVGQFGVMEEDNGLNYMRARFYSPQLRRFLGRDAVWGSLKNGQTLNPYTYAGGNPVMRVDPSGKFFWAIMLGISYMAEINPFLDLIESISKKIRPSALTSLKFNSSTRKVRGVIREVSSILKRVFKAEGTILLDVSSKFSVTAAFRKFTPQIEKIGKYAKHLSDVFQVAESGVNVFEACNAGITKSCAGATGREIGGQVGSELGMAGCFYLAKEACVWVGAATEGIGCPIAGSIVGVGCSIAGTEAGKAIGNEVGEMLHDETQAIQQAIERNKDAYWNTSLYSICTLTQDDCDEGSVEWLIHGNSSSDPMQFYQDVTPHDEEQN